MSIGSSRSTCLLYAMRASFPGHLPTPQLTVLPPLVEKGKSLCRKSHRRVMKGKGGSGRYQEDSGASEISASPASSPDSTTGASDETCSPSRSLITITPCVER